MKNHKLAVGYAQCLVCDVRVLPDTKMNHRECEDETRNEENPSREEDVHISTQQGTVRRRVPKRCHKKLTEA